MKPVAKWITLKLIKEDVTTESGLQLTAKLSDAMRYQKGEVLEVGDEVPNIKTGDKILFDQSNSYTMPIDEVYVTFIQYREVVAIL